MTEEELAENEDPTTEATTDTHEQAPAEPVTEEDRIAELEAQVSDLQQALLRTRADFDNIRKRLRREADEAGGRAVARFVRPMLSELDNFGHALTAADPNKFQEFAMGVTMIRDNLVNHLGSSGVEIIPCDGVFDPKWHEVVQEVPSPDHDKGTIVDIARQGYKIGDQVLRAAQVLVASAPPAPASDEQSVDAKEEESAE